MGHLEDVTQAELQSALAAAENRQPAQRLIAAIAYKNGVPQSELADWFDVERKTIYNWLSRLENGNLLESATDAKRSGRNRKLSDAQLAEFQEALHESPEAVGLDDPGWTPGLAQRYLCKEFGVEYSITSCRRLMKEAGLSHQNLYWRPV